MEGSCLSNALLRIMVFWSFSMVMGGFFVVGMKSGRRERISARRVSREGMKENRVLKSAKVLFQRKRRLENFLDSESFSRFLWSLKMTTGKAEEINHGRQWESAE